MDLLTIFMTVFYFTAGFYCIQKPVEIAKMVYTFFASAQGNAYAAKNWQPTSGIVWFIRALGALCLFNFAMQAFLLTKQG